MTHACSPRRRAFTLIEAALVTSIVGIGIVSMLQLLAVGTVANREGAELTTGMVLARNIREMSIPLHFADPRYEYTWDIYNPPNWGMESGETPATFNDLDDLAGLTFSPPVDARRQVLNDFTGWAQHVTVQSVDPDHLSINVPDATSPALRITVRITRNGKYVCQMDWMGFAAAQ
jgi:hypothetical protein